MTIRLRFEDFDAEGNRINLGGRTVFVRDILSIQLQKRTPAALLGYLLLAGILALAAVSVSSPQTMAICLVIGGIAGFGAFYEWRRSYVLVLQIYQLGLFEVYGIPEAAVPAVEAFFATV